MARPIGIYEYINIKESAYIKLIDEQRADDNYDDKILIHRAIAYTGMPSHTHMNMCIYGTSISTIPHIFSPHTALKTQERIRTIIIKDN